MGTTDTEYWRKLRVGEIREMNCGDQAKVLEYNNAFDIKIEFLDDYHYQTHCHYSNFQRGTVKNPYHPNKYGGVIGEGDNKISINQKMTKEYDAWMKMLARSKDEKYKQIETTYLDVDCCEEWMNFNTFADWFKENTIDYSGTKAVDKDWIKQGNRIYCPEYCAIVPPLVNTCILNHKKIVDIDLPTGIKRDVSNNYVVNMSKFGKKERLGSFKNLEDAMETYRVNKIKYVKEIGEMFKDIIDPRVYYQMAHYEDRFLLDYPDYVR